MIFHGKGKCEGSSLNGLAFPCSIACLFWCLQPVPDERFRQQKLGVPRGSFNLFSQPVDKDAKIFSLVHVLGATNLPQQLAVGNRPVSVSSKVKEEVKFFR